MVKVTVCDSSPFMRIGMSDFIERNIEGFSVTEAVENGFEFLHFFHTGIIEPGIIMLDMDTPSNKCILAASKIKRFAPQVMILAASVWEDRKSVELIVKAGATGFILKGTDKKEIQSALNDMHSYGCHINGYVSQKMLDSCRRGQTKAANPIVKLTRKETELLPLLCSNRSYKEIAAECYTSFKTIDNHSQHIFKKLNVTSRIELAMRAIQLNLIVMSTV